MVRPFLLKCLAAFCVLDRVGATSVATSVTPTPSCVSTAELKAMEKRLREEFYEQLQDVRECSGCMSPSPPPA